MKVISDNIIGIKRTEDDLLLRIENIIESAEKFILIGAYNLSLAPSTLEKLINTKSYIKVIILPYNSHLNKSEYSTIEKLAKSGYMIIINNNNHSKFMVTDKYTYTGSLNMSEISMRHRIENISIYKNLDECTLFEKDFQTIDIIEFVIDNIVDNLNEGYLNILKINSGLIDIINKICDCLIDDCSNINIFKDKYTSFTDSIQRIFYKNTNSNTKYDDLNSSIGNLQNKINNELANQDICEKQKLNLMKKHIENFKKNCKKQLDYDYESDIYKIYKEYIPDILQKLEHILTDILCITGLDKNKEYISKLDKRLGDKYYIFKGCIYNKHSEIKNEEELDEDDQYNYMGKRIIDIILKELKRNITQKYDNVSEYRRDYSTSTIRDIRYKIKNFEWKIKNMEDDFKIQIPDYSTDVKEGTLLMVENYNGIIYFDYKIYRDEGGNYILKIETRIRFEFPKYKYEICLNNKDIQPYILKIGEDNNLLEEIHRNISSILEDINLSYKEELDEEYGYNYIAKKIIDTILRRLDKNITKNYVNLGIGQSDYLLYNITSGTLLEVKNNNSKIYFNYEVYRDHKDDYILKIETEVNPKYEYEICLNNECVISTSCWRYENELPLLRDIWSDINSTLNDENLFYAILL